MRVHVTEADIAKALANDSAHCVVAQAIARQEKGATRIEVDTQTIRFSKAGERFAYLTPPVVQAYVVAFDAGDPVEPFDFSLRGPIEARTVQRSPNVIAADNAAQAAREEARAAGESEEVVKARAKAARAAVRAQARSDEPKTIDKGRRPAPRVFKSKKRSYGHRLLRINQQPGAGSIIES